MRRDRLLRDLRLARRLLIGLFGRFCCWCHVHDEYDGQTPVPVAGPLGIGYKIAPARFCRRCSWMTVLSDDC